MIWLIGLAAANPSLPPRSECTSGCVCELAYGSGPYDADKAQECLLTSSIDPAEWNIPKVLTDPELAEGFAQRGLVVGSPAAELTKHVNRLAFLADYLQADARSWTTSSMKSALQTVHVAQQLVQSRPNSRVVDVGCGVGFVAAVLAQEQQAKQVVCVEYEHWVHELSTQIFKNPAHVWQTPPAPKIDLVEGDGVKMQDVSGQPLGQFDVIIYSMGLAPGLVPQQLQAAMAEGGAFFAPQCNSADVIEKAEINACKGTWRLFEKHQGEVKEVPVGYAIPATFMLPYSERKSAFGTSVQLRTIAIVLGLVVLGTAAAYWKMRGKGAAQLPELSAPVARDFRE